MQKPESLVGFRWRWACVLLVATALIAMHAPALGTLSDASMATDAQMNAHATGMACVVALGVLASLVAARLGRRMPSTGMAPRQMVTRDAPELPLFGKAPSRNLLCIWRL